MSLKEKIDAGGFAVLAELEPPKGADFSSLLANAGLVKGRIEAFVIPEMANAVMKASSLGGCAFLQNRGFETVMQVCCRDRNRLALQADILGAAGLGIPSLMVLQGDEISYGDHHQARSVNDLSVTQLLEAIKGLAAGRDMAGIELKGAPSFLVGSLFNAGAAGGALDLEIEELKKKVELGVRFVVTSPVFDLDGFKKLLRRLEGIKVAIIPTVLLLKSAGMARYIDRNIKNITIPASLIDSIQKAPDKPLECIKIAGSLITGLREMGTAGVLISTIGWEDKLPQVLDEARL
jgi:5,10-methylenetetrahydrofolate reductase